ncbi:MAG: aldehyde dehydrogenase [Phycisphaerales bacterium]|nr:aldehyde dehydrogenase [Phycisphaerales bacterium]
MARTTSTLHDHRRQSAPAGSLHVPQVGGAATPALRRRRVWLRRFRQLLSEHRAHLAELVSQEVHKPVAEALLADVVPLLDACRWHERNLSRVLGPRPVRGGSVWQIGQRQETRREPLGRVAVIATWNYPIQLLGIQIVQALAAGNTVVVKPSERSPRSQEALLELARAAMAEAELDQRLLSWTEATREAGSALLVAERFDHIVFTGSTATGRAIAELAAQSLTPTTLELSGCDSAIVLDDADLRLAAHTIWAAVTMNAGQTCMAPRRVLVEDAAYVRFLSELAPLVAAAAPAAMIDADAARTCFAVAEAAALTGGRSVSGVLEPPAANRLRPLAIVDCPRDSMLVAGGHFGPAVAVLRVRDTTDALQVHHQHAQHLVASVFTGQRARADALVPLLGAGTVCVNDCVRPTAHPGASIGGRGDSGWGVTRGREGLLAMTRPVVVARTSCRWRLPAELPAGGALLGIDRLIGFLYGRRSRT